jgi:uncharacterized membrane protein YcaP (DUF421 family)
MFEIDWQEMLIPSKSVLEIFVRGTIIYLILFVTMRCLPRRTIGAMGPADLLVVVLIADAVQNAMSDDYESVTEGVVLAFTIFGWAVVIDWLDHKFPHWHLAEGRPLLLISDGQLVRQNMDRQKITEDEVMSQLRQHGLDSPRNVVSAFLEGDGRISVLTRIQRSQTPPPEQKALHS